jgi:hypothetical protein
MGDEEEETDCWGQFWGCDNQRQSLSFNLVCSVPVWLISPIQGIPSIGFVPSSSSCLREAFPPLLNNNMFYIHILHCAFLVMAADSLFGFLPFLQNPANLQLLLFIHLLFIMPF